MTDRLARSLRGYQQKNRPDPRWYWAAPMLLDQQRGVDVADLVTSSNGLAVAWKAKGDEERHSDALPVALDLAEDTVRGVKNGAVAETGVGANVLGDPRIALTWLVNELSQFGYPVKKNQVVITGTCVKPMAIAAGDHIQGDFGQLGGISVRIV